MLIFLKNTCFNTVARLLYGLMSPKYLHEIRKDTLFQKFHWKGVFQGPLAMFDLVNKVHV